VVSDLYEAWMDRVMTKDEEGIGLVRVKTGIVSYSRSYRLSSRGLRVYVSQGSAIHPTYVHNRYVDS
jgi:hypothetical protein